MYMCMSERARARMRVHVYENVAMYTCD